MDAWSAPVRDAAGVGRFVVQRCPDCGRARALPSLRCPHCKSARYRWEDGPTSGSLYTWTTTHRSFHPDFTEVPFTAAVVELDGTDDMHVVAQLVGVGDDDDRMLIGAPTRITVGLDERGRVILTACLSDPAPDEQTQGRDP